MARQSRFASDADDGCAVIGGADVTNVDLAKFVGSKPCQQFCENDGEIAFCQVGFAFRAVILGDGLDAGAGERSGQCLG